MLLPIRLIPLATRLHTKLVLILAILIALVVTSVAYVSIEREYATRIMELEGRADRVANLVSRSLAYSVWNVDLAAIDDQLAVLASDPEVVQYSITADGYGVLREISMKQGPPLIDPIVRVQSIDFATADADSKKKIGEFRVVLTRSLVEQAHTSAQRTNLALMALVLAVLYAATYLLLKRMVSGPVNRLEAMVDRIALGDLNARCVVESGDELGRLAVRVNTMADRLRESDAWLRESQEDLAITLHSIGDAVIATDTAGLVTRMNPTAVRLTGWPLAQALGRPLAEVFCIVSSETRLPSVNPVQLVMQHGDVVGLDHTTLLARDGQEYQIADNAAPIRNAAGQIVGVVLVFSDVTEKYRVAAALLATQTHLKATLDAIPDLLFEVDLQGLVLGYHAHRSNLQAAHAPMYVGKHLVDVMPGAAAETCMNALQEAHIKGWSSGASYALPHPQDEVWFELSVAAMPGIDGAHQRFIVLARDITERKQAEQYERFRSGTMELLAANAPLTELLETIVLGVQQLRPAMLCSILLLDSDGRRVGKAVAPSLPEFYNAVLDDFEAGLAVTDIATHSYWAAYKDFAARAGLSVGWAQPISGASGKVLGTIAIYYRAQCTPTQGDFDLIAQTANLTSIALEHKQAQGKLQLAASVFTHTREGIIITDARGRIIDANDAFTRITGYSRSEAIGQSLRMVNSGLQDDAFYKALWHDLTQNGHWSGELWNRRKNAELYAELLTVSAVRDDQGNAKQYVALFTEITAIKEHQSKIEHLAHFDTLTNLANRVLLADQLQDAMVQAQRRQQQLAVVYLDLDGFKVINDRHGHEAGDQVLITFANRMRDSMREGDTLARLGGDEFVVVLRDLQDVAASLPLLNRLLDTAALPVLVGDLTLQVSASMGVTFYPQTDDIDADQLLRQADQAMYQAKLAGKNRHHVFDAAHDSSIRSNHEGLERIRLALNRQELLLYYQPKVNMRTGKVIGAEALLRWQHPEKGLLAPATFLPLIEEHALAVDVGEWVIDAAMRQLQVWHDAGLDMAVSVNIGARQLQQTNFVERLQIILNKHPKINPARLELEILETSALADLTQVSSMIADCAQLGVRFALDDFGTGYSSLTYLRHLRVAMLKIDQSFVRDMLEDADDLAILQGVIGLAAAFRREVIAEGVETVAHGTALLELGCELAQGYGIARPMAPEQLPGWVATWQPDPAWLERVNDFATPRFIN